MQILRVLLRTAPHCLEARHIEQLAGCTHGFVGADLQLLVKESALQALRRWRNSPQGTSSTTKVGRTAVCGELSSVV
jgi:SpoVK/Ycf46/Vps4 family AAA+-type ATPase